MKRDPLTPAVFHVLHALSDGPLHGYGVMQRVESESGLRMGPGTVYGTLQRLEDRSWVQDDGEDPSDPRRRRRFRLTEGGRSALRHEVGRIHRLAELTRAFAAENR